MDAKTERMKELVELLNQASKAYYQQDTEIMSNLEYDALYDELAALEQETGLILSKSPTQANGIPIRKIMISSPLIRNWKYRIK